MMRVLSVLLSLILASAVAQAEPKVGAPAPNFEVMDATGKMRTLNEFKGKHVVLEWFNKDCPYVVKHYKSGNMQKVQADLTKQGLVWLTVISSAKGKQGHVTGEQALKDAKERGANPNAILIDDLGKMGRAYAAKTTPHMFLIDDKGVLRYAGAIDSNDSSDPAVIPQSENYIVAAAKSALKGEAIAKASTKPYGCSVKY